VVDDLGDGGEGDFDDFAVGALYLDAGARERLRLLEARTTPRTRAPVSVTISTLSLP
jgi:hypothetical protein